MGNIISLDERRKRARGDADGGGDDEEMGPMYSGMFLQVSGDPHPLYRIVIDSPDPESISLAVYVDDVSLVAGITDDTSQYVDGKSVFDVETFRPVLYHTLRFYPEIHHVAAVLHFEAPIEGHENSTFFCEWFYDGFHFE